MLALLRAEPGGDQVRDLLEDADVPKFAHAANLVEVFYDFLARADQAAASEAINDLFSLGIEERGDMDGAFWRDVAKLVADGRRGGSRLALGDAFGLALARREGGAFITADRGELEAVNASGACQITFIR